MSATDITIQQDAGTPDQLPQGEASALNDALPTETAAPPSSDAADAASKASSAEANTAALLSSPELQPADGTGVGYSPQNDDEKFLSSSSLYPDQSVTAGAGGRKVIAPEVLKNLPVLVQAANAPTASPELKALVSLLLAELNA